MSDSIKDWQKKVHALAREKGWWDGVMPGDTTVIPEKIALVHSEASEALEVYREQVNVHDPIYADPDGERHLDNPYDPVSGLPRKPVGFDSEVADIAIRVMDLCGHLGIDLEKAISEKHAFNVTRPVRHGGKRC